MAGVLLLAANLAFSPVDPLMELSAGVGAGYLLTLEVPPGFSEVRALVSTLPSDAPLLASPDLFPMVANDPNAYVIPDTDFPQTDAHLPWDAAHPPPVVLLSQDMATVVPSWLQQALYNASNYRIAEAAWGTPVGSVLLFEGGPVASVGWWGTVFYGTPPSTDQTFSASTLLVGIAGYYARTPETQTPTVIATIPGETGTLWYGPYTSLLPGNYSLSVNLSARPWSPSAPAGSSALVLDLRVTAWGQPSLFDRQLNYSSIPSAGTTLNFQFNVSAESVNVEFVGIQLAVNTIIEFDQVQIVAYVPTASTSASNPSTAE